MDKRKLQKLVNEMEQLNSNVFFVDKWVYEQMKDTITKMREELKKSNNDFPNSVQNRIKLTKNSPR